MKKKMKPSYVPMVKSLGDVSNFEEYPDSGVGAQDIKASIDPFLSWWLIWSHILIYILTNALKMINNMKMIIK